MARTWSSSVRENKATVKDEGLGTAFAEGVDEGFRLIGWVLFTVNVGGKEVASETVKKANVPDLVASVFSQFRGEHYDQGVVIRIMAIDKPAEAVDNAEVIEGEIVE
jgi:hypothetical protein